MRPFGFATATEIQFGRGIVAKQLARVAQLGTRVLLVTGGKPARLASAIEVLEARQLISERFQVTGEPTVEVAREGVSLARAVRCDVVVAIGGGSVIDTGKAIAALLTSGGDPLDYLEVVGAGRQITRPSAPFVAVPTTSGTGAEVTRNAVLESVADGVKVSMRSVHMLPRLAIVDPVLTCSMPPEVTASTGLDALTQVLEPFVSNQANALTDALCRDALRRAARSLVRAHAESADLDAREDMSFVSLCGGLALANAKLGAVHGIAGPLGGMCGGAHGALCAALLPHVMAANVAALRVRDPDSEVLERYDEVAALLTGRPEARAEDGVAWVETLCTTLGVPRLAAVGLTTARIDELVDKSLVASSMKGNPVALTRDEVVDVVRRAL